MKNSKPPKGSMLERWKWEEDNSYTITMRIYGILLRSPALDLLVRVATELFAPMSKKSSMSK